LEEGAVEQRCLWWEQARWGVWEEFGRGDGEGEAFVVGVGVEGRGGLVWEVRVWGYTTSKWWDYWGFLIS
jgi:hypothetical protein